MARKSQARLYQSESVSASLDGDAFTTLGLLAGAIRKDSLAKAVYSGARILYDELRIRAETSTINAPTHGQPTGTLKNAIYHWHDDKTSDLNRQSYVIGVNKKKAPHWHLIEYGHWMPYKAYLGNDGQWHTVRINGKPVYRSAPKFVPAYPYIRPTWDAMIDTAMQKVKMTISDNIKSLK